MLKKFILLSLLALLLGVAALQPPLQVHAQDVTWEGRYFDNPNLTGTPVLVRQDQAIAFNWGDGQPARGLPEDEFSVRWATDVFLPAGTYRFFAQADDQVSITLDFGINPILNTFGTGQTGQIVTADVQLTEGVHHIQVDYNEIRGSAFAFVSFDNIINIANASVAPTAAPPSETTAVTGGTWIAEYYNNTALAGAPTLIQSENSPNNNWGLNSPTPAISVDNWSARWRSNQNLAGGTYRLQVRSDDGVRVYINGDLVLDEWRGNQERVFTTDISLPPGANTFVVEYFESTQTAFLEYQLFRTGGQTAPTVQPTLIPTIINNTSGTGGTGGQTTLATVTGASRLNVRDQPNPVTGDVITVVNRTEVFPVVGQNADGSWVQINVAGTAGWVNANFVTLSRGAAPQQPQTDSGEAVLTAAPYAVNIRSGAGTQFDDIGTIRANDSAVLVARNANNTWYKVNYRGIVGWVTATYTRVQPGFNVNTLPVE